MTYYSGCDMHKSFSVFVEVTEHGEVEGPTRTDHQTGELQEHLNGLPEGTPVAFETSGRWYWMANKIEEAGCIPRLVNARKAKVMMGNTNKTDRLDAQGLATFSASLGLGRGIVEAKSIPGTGPLNRLARYRSKASRRTWTFIGRNNQPDR